MAQNPPSPPVVTLTFVQPPDAARCEAIAAWTREILALNEHVRISVHELQPHIARPLVVLSIVGVYLPNRDWFFTLLHPQSVVTRHAVEAVINREMEDRELKAQIERVDARDPR